MLQMDANHRLVLRHPHQNLWNDRLVQRVRRLGLEAPLIAADSVLLLASVLVRRVMLLGWRSILRAPSHQRVLYIDCGTHVHGREVNRAARWLARADLRILAFEANPAHHAEAARNLSDIDGLDLRNAALVGPGYDAPDVELFLDHEDGRGDSLLGERNTGPSVLVPAIRLSDILRTHDWPLETTVVLLRMNIEGAERFVIEDLVEADMDKHIDGFYGMWDDLSKVNPAADEEFRRLLRSRRIRKVTFNDRDGDPRLHFVARLRCAAIRVDLDTSVMHGALRKRRVSVSS
jgi:FkbM family methyltransferase